MCTANFTTRISALCLSRPFILSRCELRLFPDTAFTDLLSLMEANGVPCEVLNLPPLANPCPPLLGPSARPLTSHNPAYWPFREPRHQPVFFKCDHGPQEGLDYNTDFTVTSTDRQIMIFVCYGPFLCISQPTDRPYRPCRGFTSFNPLSAQLNPICPLLALLGSHHILHVSR